MQRGEINNLMRAAEHCFVAHGWALPPNARCDVTDFGLGAWRQFELVLVDLAEEPAYCDKLMYAQGGMRTPAHCHRSKKEDIICREQHRESIIVPVNREPAAILSGAVSELDARSRITLLPEFYPLSQQCILREVSTANDDTHDNYFVNPNIGRYPGIAEDEVAIVRLVSEE